MTQKDLADAIKAEQKSISRYETGPSLPALETLEKMAKVLKKFFGYFLDEYMRAVPDWIYAARTFIENEFLS